MIGGAKLVRKPGLYFEILNNQVATVAVLALPPSQQAVNYFYVRCKISLHWEEGGTLKLRSVAPYHSTFSS